MSSTHQHRQTHDYSSESSEGVGLEGAYIPEQNSLGNSAMLQRAGLQKTDDDGEADPEADLGPTEVSHGSAAEIPPPDGDSEIADFPTADELVAPVEPPRAEIESAQPEIRQAGQFVHSIPVEAPQDTTEGLGEIPMEFTGDSEFESLGTSTQQIVPMTEAEFAAYEQQTYDIVNNTIENMSTEDIRSSLQEMGYSGESVDSMTDTERAAALAGNMNKAVRSVRIQGMTPDEIDRLPAKEQRQFLTDLGVPAADLWKAEDRYVRQAVLDVVAVAKTPGHHNVQLKIRGGWLRGKSYDIKLQVSDEGHLADVDIEKRGGFLSKIGGLIKRALPIIAKLLAGFTGGLSLLALAVYNAVEAARNGNWVGAISSVAGGFVAVGLDGVAAVADKVASIADSAVSGLRAIKDRNLGGIIGAFASGAETFATFAGDQAGGFATTAREWADKARTWGGFAVGGVGVIQAIRGRDPFLAISGALDLAVAIRDRNVGDEVGPPTSLSNNPGVLVTSQRLSGFALNAKNAVTGEPPQYGLFAANIFSMAGEYTTSGKVAIGRNLSLHGQTFEAAVRSGDWSAAGQAVLDISETIELAHAGDDISDEDKQDITDKYDTAQAIVVPGLDTVEAVSTGNWASALVSGLQTARGAELARADETDADRINEKYRNADRYIGPSISVATALSSGNWGGLITPAFTLGTLLTSSGAVEIGATISKIAEDLVSHIQGKNLRGIRQAATALWDALQNLWGDASSGAETVQTMPSVPALAPAPPPSGPGSAPRTEGPAGDTDAMLRALCWRQIELYPSGVQLDMNGCPVADYGAATQADGEAVVQEMMRIPLGGIQRVHCNQTTVTVCHNNVTIARPDMVSDWPRNWEEGATWTQVPGGFFPDRNQVVICTNDGEIATNHGSDNLVVHEVGHAIDQYVNGDADPDFLRARELDLCGLSNYEQEINGGASETYAESMARFHGKTVSDWDKILYKNLYAYWQSVPLKPLW